MEAYIGLITMFAGNFAPRGWQFCNGQLLAISQNTALFSILGTTYGGNGQTTFALPDLRGRVPAGQGAGPGLPPMQLGEMAGSPTQTLIVNNMPAHSHALNCAGSANAYGPTNNFNAEESNQTTQVYSTGPAAGIMNPQAIGLTGGNQPFSLMQPYLGLSFIICVEGIFPSRN